ncbi:hypothetical protein R9C00_17315 [Flammeovirgaceae bacterium SG7u.111]|nr:hypothetical protein [Flammeovirgaceae bacterium SG7u.132]WPO33462.1 hypothetical protein R9C00_17315 [Flammeovirgaceae bacterium SG7u.111]
MKRFDYISFYDSVSNENIEDILRNEYSTNIDEKNFALISQHLLLPKKRMIVLMYLQKIPTYPISLLHLMFKAGISETDPSANGYFIKPYIELLGVQKVSDLLFDYYYNGNDLMKTGVLKVFYHVHWDYYDWDEKEQRIVEDIELKRVLKLEYEERKRKLLIEYQKCDNLVMKFFYQWALPNERDGILKGLPESSEDLVKFIKGDARLETFYQQYRKGDYYDPQK